MQDCIRLQQVAFDNPILPKHRVTSLVECSHVLDRLIKIDGTLALVHGKLCYPRVDWDILPSHLQNHKSCEVDAVKIKLGTKMAGPGLVLFSGRI